MTWLRSNWKNALVVVALVATVASIAARTRALAEADTWRSISEERADEIASRQREIDAQGARLVEAAREVAEATERAENATSKLTEVRDSAAAVGDSIDAEAEAEADSTGGWIRIELYRDGIASKDAELAASDSATAVWRGGFERVQTYADSLFEAVLARDVQIAGYENLVVSKDSEISSLRDAIAPSFGVRLLENWELVVGGIALGVLGWELAR